MPLVHNALAIKIFLTALAIRWAYDLILFGAMGDAGLMGIDSSSYLNNAVAFAAAIKGGTAVGWDWLGPDPYIMPLFGWLVTLTVLIAGKWAVLAYVLLQGILDAFTCVFVLVCAAMIHRKLAVPAGIAAAINPTQIVLSGIVYSDTPFVFFVALTLWSAIKWMRAPSWPISLALAAGLGGAVLCRAVILAWIPALFVILALVMLISRRLKGAQIAQLFAAAAIFIICVAPIYLRNASLYNSWALTPQSGMHLSRWVAPLVKEAKDGTPWRISNERLEQRAVDRYGPVSGNPFEQSRRYTSIAMEELRELGLAPAVKAWAFGIALNLGSPAIIISPLVAQLPRTGFYATAGNSPGEKLWNFLIRSDNATYALVLVLGIAGVAAIRLVQLCGIASLAAGTANIPALLLFGSWIGYILLVNGPIASPKYRLPIEPILNVMTAAGWVSLRQRTGRKPAR